MFENNLINFTFNIHSNLDIYNGRKLHIRLCTHDNSFHRCISECQTTLEVKRQSSLVYNCMIVKLISKQRNDEFDIFKTNDVNNSATGIPSPKIIPNVYWLC